MAPTLQAAFEQRADGTFGSGVPKVGIFGSGLPTPLIAAAGAFPLDVKAPPLSDERDGPLVPAVSVVAEDFLDPFATRFLHRFASGAFDEFALILFERDDVAALAAYQYAQELRRQGRTGRRGPKLHLWNMVHAESVPAQVFNRTELARLVEALSETLGAGPEAAALDTVMAQEARRFEALERLPAGGAAAFIARNAGRWLPPLDHAALVEAVAPAGPGPSIALIGTACDVPAMHTICEEFGVVTADLQEYGRTPNFGVVAEPEAIVQALAQDPLHLRAMPPARFTDALAEGIGQADLIIASVDRNDDAFGWEIPKLRASVEDRGGRFLDLGFRPFRPDGAWLDRARSGIREVLA